MSTAKPDDFYLSRGWNIGASDAATILGVGWGDAYTLFRKGLSYQEGHIPDDEQTEAQEWGHRHERAVAEKCAENRGMKAELNPADVSTTSVVFDWMTATIDAVLLPDHPVEKVPWEKLTRERDAVEVKSFLNFLDDEDPNEPRIYDLVQVQHQLFVTGRKQAWLAYLISGNKYKEHLVLRDDEFISSVLLPSLIEFRNRLIEKNPPDVTHKSRRFFSRYKNIESTSMLEKEVVLAPEFEKIDETLNKLKEVKKETQQEIDRLESMILASMGDKEVAYTPTGVRYKRTLVKGSTYQVTKEDSIRLYRKGKK